MKGKGKTTGTIVANGEHYGKRRQNENIARQHTVAGKAVGYALVQPPSPRRVAVVGLTTAASGISNWLQYINDATLCRLQAKVRNHRTA